MRIFTPHAPFLLWLALCGATLLLLPPAARATDPTFEPTFHAIGIYWKPASGGAATNACGVQYRRVGDTAWSDGLPLWFDTNTAPLRREVAGTVQDLPRPVERHAEYRGSIVDLTPGTAYEIQLQLASAPAQTLTGTVSTWSETFAELGAATVVANRTAPYTISTGGTAGAGGNPDQYKVYVAAPPPATGASAGYNIDVAIAADETLTPASCITVSAPYVIVRGFKLRGAKNGIVLTANAHHVVIEHCEITGWGTFKYSTAASRYTEWGTDEQAGIYCSSTAASHLVIQHNHLHFPRTRANSWGTAYLKANMPGSIGGVPSNGHPQGPHGIKFSVETQGRHVIRYNSIWSADGAGDGDAPTAGHGFNDGIGGKINNSYYGFPGRDSDIYCNYIANCWDDGIEAEGGGLNVRVWGNVIEYSFTAVAQAGCSLGPFYSFRNITGFSRSNPQVPGDPDHEINTGLVYPYGVGAFKLGSSVIDTTQENANSSAGRAYIFHNTLRQPLFKGRLAGMRNGLNAQTRDTSNLYARNNLLDVGPRREDADPDNDGYCIYLGHNTDIPTTNVAYNYINDDPPNGNQYLKLKNGLSVSPSIIGALAWPATFSLTDALGPGSVALDAGEDLKNFTASFNLDGPYADAIARPDLGAIETGKAVRPPFGVGADWSAYLRDEVSADPAGFVTWASAFGLVNPDPTADTDGDGVSDLLEFLFGHSPVQASDPSPFDTATAATGGATFAFKTARRAAALHFAIEATQDLPNFTGQNVPFTLERTQQDETYDYWSVTLAPTAPPPRAFLRLRVTY